VTAGALPTLIVDVGSQLRRRQFALGVDDYDALRRALAAGFGWSSDDELRDLCVALWAKSREDAEIVRAAFSRSGVGGEAAWNVVRPGADATDAEAVEAEGRRQPADGAGRRDEPEVKPVADLGSLPPSTGLVDRGVVLVAQYPMSERDVAQAWRRLRRPLRTGPALELDIAATLAQRSRHGVATPPILVPRRRNTAKLLLLIDRNGSMTPFHGYVDHVVRAIRSAGRLDNVRVAYFHDLPGRMPDHSVLGHLEDPFRPDLDAILPLIQPLTAGYVYDDPELIEPQPLSAVLDQLTAGTAAVVISDAGAARRRFDTMRLLDTVSLLKALHSRAATTAWLNPIRPSGWVYSIATQIARHVPMYPLTRDGLNRAIDTLRGRPEHVEHSL
jgi:uncharacterized protein